MSVTLLGGPALDRAVLRAKSGETLPLPGKRWLQPVDEGDAAALDAAIAPVLDLGCGPGRHVEALAARGMIVLGIDLSSHAVEIARDKGLAILERSIFDTIPKAGQWASALLLDGNIGIGGSPVGLLRHVASLLSPRGRIVIEVDEFSTGLERRVVCLEIDGVCGPWFAWSTVGVPDVVALAEQAELSGVSSWECDGRYFSVLEIPG